jgi:molybdate transport system ATP-binding protein
VSARAHALSVDVVVRRGDFEVRAAFVTGPGETVALLGPNGSGKSTLVSVIAGLLPVERGRTELEGRALDAPADGVAVPAGARPIGVVFQDLLLFPHLSAVENVMFPLRARGVGHRAALGRAEATMRRLRIDHRANARPGTLSGGEAQRVALARALVVEPRLLLLDEPLSALDLQARSETRSLLRRILREFDGVRVLVTHDPVEALTLSDRMVLLESGRVTQIGTPEDIRDRPATQYAADLVGLNLFSGRLEPLGDGAGRLVTPAGPIVVVWPHEAAGAMDGVSATVRPADVSLHVRAPEGGSARNVIEGLVRSVSLEGERARVRLDAEPPVVSEVTLGSVSRLGLAEGVRVWASFKAVEVRVTLPY